MKKFTEIFRITPTRAKTAMSYGGERWGSTRVKKVPPTAPATIMRALAMSILLNIDRLSSLTLRLFIAIIRIDCTTF
jgi:hypothetical protein